MGNAVTHIGLKAALGKINITPEERVSLQGYDPESNIADPKKDILDPLFAKVLILDDGRTRNILVSVDSCLTNEESVKVADPSGRSGPCREFINTFPAGTRKRWANAAGTTEANISVNATHTHSAPAAYSNHLISRIEKSIAELTEQFVPVKLSVGVGESNISAFRRPKLRADFNVPVNQALKVMFIETMDNHPLGAIVNYAVHPTALRNPTNRVSGDIVGLAMSDLENQFGNGFVSLFLQGFSGDICPIYGDNGPVDDTYPEVIKGSRILSSDIMNTITKRKSLTASSLNSEFKRILLPTRKGFYKEDMEVALVGFAIGDALIVSISGEVFNEYIQKIESISPYEYTFLSGVANGYSGYIPTHKAFQDGLGGYEINTTPYSESVEELLMREVKLFINSLKDE